MKRINKNNITELDLVIYVNIKWRFQKNNDNGQVITYAKASDHNNPHCFVNARSRFYPLLRVNVTSTVLHPNIICMLT